MITRLAASPLAFADAGFDYAGLAARIADAVSSTDAVDFGFKREVAVGYHQESDRKIVPLQQAFAARPDVRGELNEWARTRMPLFLRALYESVACSDLVMKAPEDLRFALRVRVIEDQPGFSLAPHKDSSDTVFAFLLQLSPENPTTSGFLKRAKSIVIDKKAMRDPTRGGLPSVLPEAIERIYGYRPQLSFTANQFSERIVAWEQQDNIWFIDESDERFEAAGFEEVRLDPPFGSLLAVHNPARSEWFRSPLADFNVNNARHGVFPRVYAKRPLVLLDLLGAHSKGEHISVEGVGSDPNSYFVIFRRETSQRMMREAGFWPDGR